MKIFRNLGICSVAVSLFLGSMPMNCSAGYVQASNEKKPYIVCTKGLKQLEKITNDYEEAEDVGLYAENQLQENKMASVYMTESEAEGLLDKTGVSFVEEDAVVEAAGTEKHPKKYHAKKEKKIKENKSDVEWNVRMVNGNSRTVKECKKEGAKKEKIKVALIDSGVDYGNDIDLAGWVTLVPGEEDMNPLFMDATGHGNSVAGLIAATDNDKGITGINPNVELYSIQVLDENNCSPVSRVVEAIYMAIEKKVHIINMSFGISQYSAALEQAVKDADAAGILMIASAGNTGEDGVQYPAAFDEVMAVGSVDKNADVTDTSAVGEEVEIVAPGELVRSTGVLGDERVSSGTSLAAPQVAGAASLIWEKNPDMPADFVRSLLNESANQYGESQKYGNGLLDIDYALKHYDSFRNSYNEEDKTGSLEENEKEVLCFEETNCIEGNWSGKKHEEMPALSDYDHVKKGARFPDTKDKEYVPDNDEDKCIFARLSINPWWHGSYRKSTNYVAAYIYQTRLANKIRYGGTADIPYSLSSTAVADIQSDLTKINWEKELDTSFAFPAERRAFVWGMAIHNLADAFAHSTYIKDSNGQWVHLGHEGTYNWADSTKKNPNRYKHACEAVELAMLRFVNSGHVSGTYEEFKPVKKATGYRMKDIYVCMKEVAGSGVAEEYKSVSINDR